MNCFAKGEIQAEDITPPVMVHPAAARVSNPALLPALGAVGTPPIANRPGWLVHVPRALKRAVITPPAVGAVGTPPIANRPGWLVHVPRPLKSPFIMAAVGTNARLMPPSMSCR